MNTSRDDQPCSSHTLSTWRTGIAFRYMGIEGSLLGRVGLILTSVKSIPSWSAFSYIAALQSPPEINRLSRTPSLVSPFLKSLTAQQNRNWRCHILSLNIEHDPGSQSQRCQCKQQVEARMKEMQPKLTPRDTLWSAWSLSLCQWRTALWTEISRSSEDKLNSVVLVFNVKESSWVSS